MTCTRDDLDQVLLTMAASRRAAMVGGGQVTIEIADVEIDEACARERGGFEPGAYVLVAWHASGPGVDATFPARLDTAPGEATWQNAGPGMAAVFRLVRRVGGQLWATAEGPDTVAFEVYLPAGGEPAQAPAAGHSSETQ